MKPARALEWTAESGEESSLIARCSRGEQEACRQLMDEHQRMVYRLGFQILGNEDEAHDISQEVFLRVFRTIHKFRGGSTLRTWIYRIAINQARNRQRWWRRRRQAYHVSLDAMTDAHHADLPSPPRTSSPDGMFDRKELSQRLWDALSRLPFEQRTALVLRELHGMRYAEIAYSLDVSVGAIKSRLARAREKMRWEMRTS